MITLCMDTSYIFLTLVLVKDHEVLGKYQKECWKKQSEEIFPALQNLLNENKLTPDDIDQVVITRGPGSYTGVRIAMTIAKVFCAMKNKPLYTISTLQLYAGTKTCRVILDARGGRCYTCAYKNGLPTEDEKAIELKELDLTKDTAIVGTGSLVNRTDNYPDFAERFITMFPYAKKAENIHLVAPEYLKDKAAYLPGQK